ncbi:MAG: hypothetical protein LBL96_00500 [Clostridiales bacterium]|jgi:hypothetical protein|nr:hypothetical protein [Clostridiales bacterium]
MLMVEFSSLVEGYGLTASYVNELAFQLVSIVLTKLLDSFRSNGAIDLARRLLKAAG